MLTVLASACVRKVHTLSSNNTLYTHSAVHHKIHGTSRTYAQRACALPCQAAGNSQADKPASTAQYRVTQAPNLKTHSKTGPTTSTVLGFLAQSAVCQCITAQLPCEAFIAHRRPFAYHA